MKDYAIVFSSFYKAAYARDLLQAQRIWPSMGKIPASMMKSCGYALYLEEPSMEAALEILKRKDVSWKEVLSISNSRG